MATFTWRGISGSWNSSLSWQPFQTPGSQDAALFTATDSSTADIAGPEAIGSVAFAGGSHATLLIQGALSVAGTLALSAGTLDLGAGGTILGGTVDVAGGSFVASGGIADGVAWLGPLGDGLAITAATATATEAAGAGLDVAGTLTLEPGYYDAVAFIASTYAAAPEQIDTAAGASVTLGSTTTLTASADDPLHEAQVPPSYAGLTLGGAGSFVNDGLIVSDLATAYSPLTIDAAGFVNAGTLALNTTIVPDLQQSFTIRQGRFPTQVTLTFNATYAPGLLERSATFDNSGTIVGQAASIEVTSASFTNTGSLILATAQAQMPIVTASQAYVGTVALESTIDFAASVTTFVNTGTIEAGLIEFDGNLTLAQLGTLQGAVLFEGTLDLGGGTLDAGKLNPTGGYTFAGTVTDGTLIRDGGVIVTTGATLQGVTVLDQAPGTILDALSGRVTLDAATTELAYTTAASVDDLSVVAGAVGVTDLVGARAPGTLSFGAATTITDTVAGSTIEIGGQGIFSDAGMIVLDGATLGIATLDGAGTISLADGAALQIGALSATNAITVKFGAGDNLLSLPTDASGMNALGLIVAGLHPGDLIDFAGVSSNPPVGSFGNPGAGVQSGTLDVQGASGARASVALAGSASGLTFSVGSDPTGGTLVSVTCFLRGTRIATPAGEAPVEALRIGDLVRTASGCARPVKWIGRRAYPRATVAAQQQLRPVRFAAGSLGGGLPRRPLRVSPLHGMLLPAPDNRLVLVPAAALVNNRTITRARIAAVSYFHIELETPDSVLAEGAAAETFVDCDSRALFHNAGEFAALYPDHSAMRWQFCAPRVEEGWLLEAIRAALPGGPRPRSPGGHLGWHIDQQSDGRIEGWVLDHADPSSPIAFEAIGEQGRLACAVANRYRIDLDRAGLRDGMCGFTLDLPGIDAAALASVRLRTLRSGATLSR